MRLSIQNGGQCALCAFRASRRLMQSNRRDVSRVAWHSTSSPRVHVEKGKSAKDPNQARQARNRIIHHEPNGPSPRIRLHPSGTSKANSEGGLKERDYFAAEAQSSRANITIGTFRRLLNETIATMERKLVKDLQNNHPDAREFLREKEKLIGKITTFEAEVSRCCDLAQKGHTNKTKNLLFYQLRRAFLHGDVAVLIGELRNAFTQRSHGMQFDIDPITKQERLTDMRNPLDWYPATRAIQREIHLHVGPTNSGKTYHALKRLEEAKTGVYAGPLRLLAHEVYSRFNAKGKACALITGEEHRVPENMQNYMTSCTVEMVPLNANLEVAVIDEIQMLADQERGWAWTQALLGLKAKEIHLCGEVRATDLIRKLCALMGDKLIIHNYERLTPLKSMHESLKGDLSKLQKGDAVILFSRVAIHAMKTNIEKQTGKRCAVVYGSLPPETRAQQAALFNDPDNDYDFLVASDAVGMGLNLSIKRVIFEATSKFDGLVYRLMPASHIKQIAGRAGRFKSASEAISQGVLNAESAAVSDGEQSPKSSNVGYVTTLENFDLPIVRAAMRNDVEPLQSAGMFPPAHIIERFASYFPPGTPFSYILLRLHEMASVHPLFFLCQLGDQIEVSDLLHNLDLTVRERLTLMAAPVQVRDPGFAEITKELAACVASKTTNGHILDLKTFDLELLEKDIHDHPNGVKGFLRSAEALHKAITLYMWLSYRFAGMFTSHTLALHLKTLTEQKIEQCLSVFEYDASAIKARTFLRKKQLAKQMEEISRRKSELYRARERPSEEYGLADLERVVEESDELEEAIDLENVVENDQSAENPPLLQRMKV